MINKGLLYLPLRDKTKRVIDVTNKENIKKVLGKVLASEYDITEDIKEEAIKLLREEYTKC